MNRLLFRAFQDLYVHTCSRTCTGNSMVEEQTWVIQTRPECLTTFIHISSAVTLLDLSSQQLGSASRCQYMMMSQRSLVILSRHSPSLKRRRATRIAVSSSCSSLFPGSCCQLAGPTIRVSGRDLELQHLLLPASPSTAARRAPIFQAASVLLHMYCRTAIFARSTLLRTCGETLLRPSVCGTCRTIAEAVLLVALVLLHATVVLSRRASLTSGV